MADQGRRDHHRRADVDRRRQRDQGEDRQLAALSSDAASRGAARRKAAPHIVEEPHGEAEVPGPDRARARPLTVSRIVTGLWQVADMERDGAPCRPRPRRRRHGGLCRGRLRRVRHGRPLRQRRGHRRPLQPDRAPRARCTSPPGDAPAIFTKWCPTPGPMTPRRCAPAVMRALDRLASTRIDLLQLHWWMFQHPAWIDALAELAKLREEGLIGHLGADQFRHRPSAPCRPPRDPDRHQPGLLLAARPPRRRGDVGVLRRRGHQAAGLRHARRRAPDRPMAGQARARGWATSPTGAR